MIPQRIFYICKQSDCIALTSSFSYITVDCIFASFTVLFYNLFYSFWGSVFCSVVCKISQSLLLVFCIMWLTYITKRVVRRGNLAKLGFRIIISCGVLCQCLVGYFGDVGRYEIVTIGDYCEHFSLLLVRRGCQAVKAYVKLGLTLIF